MESLTTVLVIAALFLGVAVFCFVGLLPLYGVFKKAGRPGWAAFVPFYSQLTLLDIVGRPAWWLVLLFIPGVNIVVGAIICYELAKSFDRGAGFAVGLVFLHWIFLMILWMGPSTYEDPIEGRSNGDLDGVSSGSTRNLGTEVLYPVFFGLAILTTVFLMVFNHSVLVIVYGVLAITVFGFFLGSAMDTSLRVSATAHRRLRGDHNDTSGQGHATPSGMVVEDSRDGACSKPKLSSPQLGVIGTPSRNAEIRGGS
jgi:hypothetical protein